MVIVFEVFHVWYITRCIFTILSGVVTLTEATNSKHKKLRQILNLSHILLFQNEQIPAVPAEIFILGLAIKSLVIPYPAFFFALIPHPAKLMFVSHANVFNFIAGIDKERR